MRNFSMGDLDTSLIQEFADRPAFYDKTSPHYKDKLFIEQAWQEISAKLGYDVALLKDRIYQLRNRYNLEKRKVESMRLEGIHEAKSSWPLFCHLTFLDGHIRPRKSYKSMMRRSMIEPGMHGGGSDFGSPGGHGGGMHAMHGGNHHQHHNSNLLHHHHQQQQQQHQHHQHQLQQRHANSIGHLTNHNHHHLNGGGGGASAHDFMSVQSLVGGGGGGGGNNHHHSNSNQHSITPDKVEIKYERGGGDGSDVPEIYPCDFEATDDDARNVQSQNGDHFINPAQFLDDTESEHDPNLDVAQANQSSSNRNNQSLTNNRPSIVGTGSGSGSGGNNLLLRNINSLKRSYPSNNDAGVHQHNTSGPAPKMLYGGKFKMPAHHQHANNSHNSNHHHNSNFASSASNFQQQLAAAAASHQNGGSASEQQQQQRSSHQSSDKFNAFGAFLTSSLLDMPEHRALGLVERFTNDIVRALLDKSAASSPASVSGGGGGGNGGGNGGNGGANSVGGGGGAPSTASSNSADEIANTPASANSSSSTVEQVDNV